MIVNTVINPEVFSEEYFKDERYIDQAIVFLQDIKINGLILSDIYGIIEKEIFKKVLNIKNLEKEIEALLSFLRSNKRIIRCKTKEHEETYPSNFNLFAYNIHKDLESDCLMSDNNAINYYSLNKMDLSKIECLDSFIRKSEFRKLIRDFEEQPPIDDLNLFNWHISRFTKYSKKLLFFDKQIGNSLNNIVAGREYFNNYVKGISHILSIWQNNGHFSKLKEAMVEIYTCRPNSINDEQEFNRKSVLFYQKINNGFRFPIRFFIKTGNIKKFHPRHLKNQSHILSIDHGFDIFYEKGQLGRQIIKLDNPSKNHLDEFCNLPDFKIFEK